MTYWNEDIVPADIVQHLKQVKESIPVRDARNVYVVQKSEVPPHQIWVNPEMYDSIKELINNEDKKIRNHDH